MAANMQAIFTSSLMFLMLVLANVDAGRHRGKPVNRRKGSQFKPGPWTDAHATFYGQADGSETFGGACGYEEEQVKELHGVNTTALSTALFKDGESCGACYEIKCAQGNQWCKPGQPTIFVTATNYCPPGGLGWCNAPNEHFDLSQPAFLQIAEYKAGIVPVKYRRVPCKTEGGIRFKITGNPYFNLVTIANVGGAGDVTKVEVKAGNKPWTALKRNWGQKWETDAKLVGEKLTFRITTSDGRRSTSKKAVPESWQFDQTFEGKNFK